MKVRLAGRIGQSPVGNRAVSAFDHGRDGDAPSCAYSEIRQVDFGLQFKLVRRAAYVNRRGFDCSGDHPRAVVAETVSGPLRGWCEIDFTIVRRAGRPDEHLEAGAAPKLVGSFGASHWRKAQLCDFATHTVVQAHRPGPGPHNPDVQNVDGGRSSMGMAKERSAHSLDCHATCPVARGNEHPR